jgi:hypothetical protein
MVQKVGSVGEYQYFYGAGCKPNRKIEFVRDGSDKSVHAVVYARSEGKDKLISDVPSDHINVEMMSLSEKIEAIKAQRLGIDVERKPDKTMSELSVEEQDRIIEGLKPEGPWKIAVTNSIGKDPKFENVVYINIYS